MMQCHCVGAAAQQRPQAGHGAREPPCARAGSAGGQAGGGRGGAPEADEALVLVHLVHLLRHAGTAAAAAAALAAAGRLGLLLLLQGSGGGALRAPARAGQGKPGSSTAIHVHARYSTAAAPQPLLTLSSTVCSAGPGSGMSSRAQLAGLRFRAAGGGRRRRRRWQRRGEVAEEAGGCALLVTPTGSGAQRQGGPWAGARLGSAEQGFCALPRPYIGRSGI